MNISKLSPKLFIGFLLAAFFFISFSFRAFLPHDQVFVGDWIKFTGNDAYFNMRLVDIMVHNFPHLINFDPYLIYPGGSGVSSIQFFSWILGAILWIIGLGSPTQHTIDVFGVYFPVILAALTVIPVYFIGKTLFNRWAGILAAGLVAVMPGEFMGRSILGATDYHIAETLFSTTAVLFLILAFKTARQRQATISHFRHGDWATITRPIVYSILAGAFLGIYIITWGGGLLFAFIITVYLIIQFIIEHLRHKSNEYLGITGVITFLITLIVFLPFTREKLMPTSLTLALFTPLVLLVISRVMAGKQIKPIYYPLTLIVIAVIGVAIFYAINPDLLGQMLERIKSVFIPAGATATTTLEMQPFLSPQGSFSTQVAWGNFTTSFFLFTKWPIPGFAIISFVILIYLYFKQHGDEKHSLFFLVWTLIILIATLVQRRFAYYLVINISLLSAYLCWQAIWYSGLRKLVAKPEETEPGVNTETKKSKIKSKRKERPGITIYYINTILAIIVVFVFVFLFNIFKSKEVASNAPFAPSDAWQDSLLWMKENTPDPFDNTGAYYELYELPPDGGSYTYPQSAYGVTSWWDYGYWITRIAHRLPSSNPSQSPAPIKKTAELLLSNNETRIHEIIKELDSSYVIADYSMSISKFWAIVTWAKQEQNKYTGVYYVPYKGQIVPIQLFYPEYYRCLIIRLYNFDGKAVTTVKPLVVTYEEKVDKSGIKYRQITDMKEFSSFKEAIDYVNNNKSGKHDIVSSNAFVSPVPLEAMKDYKIIYSSKFTVSVSDNNSIPEVKIFEYTGNRSD